MNILDVMSTLGVIVDSLRGRLVVLKAAALPSGWLQESFWAGLQIEGLCGIPPTHELLRAFSSKHADVTTIDKL